MGAQNPSPVLFGPNSTALNLENAELFANGVLVDSNGPKNIITYCNFENGLTTGWSLGTTGTLTNGIPTGTPTFGSGAAGTTTISINAATPISGVSSLLLASSAATVAGNMLASDPYTLNPEFRGAVLSFSTKYQASLNSANINFSGSSSSSFGMSAWDVTNSVWLTPANNFPFIQGSGVGNAQVTFQTNITTAVIRFVIYAVTATAGAANMTFDSIFAGAQANSTSLPTVAFRATGATASITSSYSDVAWTTVVSDTTASFATPNYTAPITGFYNVAGELSVQAAGFSAGQNFTVALFNTTTSATLLETVMMYQGTVSGNNSIVFNFDSVQFIAGQQFKIQIKSTASASPSITASATQNFLSVNLVSAPSIGAAADGAIVFSRYTTSATTTSTANQPFNFDLIQNDTAASVVPGATWKFTAPSTGYYCVSAAIYLNVTTNYDMTLYKNGSAYARLQEKSSAATGDISGSTSLLLNAGDTIDVRVGITAAVFAGSAYNWISIFRINVGGTPAAAPTVNMKYLNTAGTSVPNTGDNNVPFPTRVYDTHNAYNTSTGIYTVPLSGKYSVKGTINYASATYGVNNQLVCSVYKNGAVDTYGDLAPVMAVVTLAFGSVIDTTVLCNAGDTIEVRAQNTRSAGATTLSTGAGLNHIEISRSN